MRSRRASSGVRAGDLAVAQRGGLGEGEQVGGVGQEDEPVGEPGDPGDYAEWAFSDELSAEIWFARPRVTGEETAACEWWAISTSTDGKTVTLAGVSLLHFAPDGRVGDQRDYWSELEGSREPPDDWGPVAARCSGGR